MWQIFNRPKMFFSAKTDDKIMYSSFSYKKVSYIESYKVKNIQAYVSLNRRRRCCLSVKRGTTPVAPVSVGKGFTGPTRKGWAILTVRLQWMET